MSDNMTVLLLMAAALLAGIWGMSAALEAVTSRTYWLIVIAAIMSAFAGLCFGKLIWGVC